MIPQVSIDVGGAGLVSPAGSDLAAFWEGLSEPPSTETLDLNGSRVLVRRSVSDAVQRYPRAALRRMDRTHQLALPAAADALEDLPFDLPSRDRCAVCVGVGYGSSEYGERQFRLFLERGSRAVNPLTIPIVMPNSIAAHLSIAHGFTGPVHTFATACAAGATAIGEGVWMLRSGRADLVLAGGVDALLVPGVASFFARMDAMSSNFDHPELASRPFDEERDGFVLGEGAGFVVLTRSSDTSLTTENRLGQILGYGANSDAHHLVAPPDSGSGAEACMRLALRDAGLGPDDVGHVNAHGTSTRKNDLAEAQAIHSVFGSSNPAVTSIKGVTGHLVGGSGAVECIAALMTSRSASVPPVWGTHRVDRDIDIDVVIGSERRSLVKTLGVTNSFGFGGHNATLVVSS